MRHFFVYTVLFERLSERNFCQRKLRLLEILMFNQWIKVVTCLIGYFRKKLSKTCHYSQMWIFMVYFRLNEPIGHFTIPWVSCLWNTFSYSVNIFKRCKCNSGGKWNHQRHFSCHSQEKSFRIGHEQICSCVFNQPLKTYSTIFFLLDNHAN